jgi:hypothetical protein
VQTQGLVLYGLPELGLYALELRGPREAIAIIQGLSADMMTWGYAPPEGAELTVAGRPWRVSREGCGVWLDPADASASFLQQSRSANAHASLGALARAQLNAPRVIQGSVEPPGSPPPGARRLEVRRVFFTAPA